MSLPLQICGLVTYLDCSIGQGLTKYDSSRHQRTYQSPRARKLLGAIIDVPNLYVTSFEFQDTPFFTWIFCQVVSGCTCSRTFWWKNRLKTTVVSFILILHSCLARQELELNKVSFESTDESKVKLTSLPVRRYHPYVFLPNSSQHMLEQFEFDAKLSQVLAWTALITIDLAFVSLASTYTVYVTHYVCWSS